MPVGVLLMLVGLAVTQRVAFKKCFKAILVNFHIIWIKSHVVKMSVLKLFKHVAVWVHLRDSAKVDIFCKRNCFAEIVFLFSFSNFIGFFCFFLKKTFLWLDGCIQMLSWTAAWLNSTVVWYLNTGWPMNCDVFVVLKIWFQTIFCTWLVNTAVLNLQPTEMATHSNGEA